MVPNILLGIQRDRGLVDFDQPIANYWPEFAQNGKDKITLKDVIRHDAGLWKFNQKIKPEQAYTENILKNEIGKIIEAETPVWPLGEQRTYHQFTKDLITNEVFRRVDPQGRTMTQFMEQEWTHGDLIHMVSAVTEAKKKRERPMLNGKEVPVQKIVTPRQQSTWMLLKTAYKGPSENTYSLATLK